MKSLFTFFFSLAMKLSFSQGQTVNLAYVDRKVQNVDVSSPDSLAQKLTSSYVTDLEKLRSIFRWITENISYRTKNVVGSRRSIKYMIEEEDTLSQSLNERIAVEVLKKREAVCDGYARLFKILCDYAGLRSEIITGYARSNIDRVGSYFKSNHRWNAVFLDSSWHLLDVTWASGYISYGDQFIRAYDNYYFMTPPEQFIRDHYPEDSRWTLLTNPPTLKEFYRTPFKHSAFSKYSIVSFAPAKGIIEASVGDTIKVELTMGNSEKHGIAPDTLKDDTHILPLAFSLDSLKPVFNDDKKRISYQYTINSPSVEWLNVMYNDDVILRYKLNIRKNKEE